MNHVRNIAVQPHPTGSPANAEVRAYLQQQMERVGAEVTFTQSAAPPVALDRYARWSGNRPNALTITNVIGVVPGRDRSLDAIALMAHHDTVYGSPGAPDDTAGLAAILETVRAIRERGGADRDIVVVLTDGEELGLLGARDFVDRNSLARRIGAFINLEARGGGGRTSLFQTSRDNGNAIRVYADNVTRPAGSSLATYIYEVLPNDTDLTPVLDRGFTGYNLSFIGRPGLYHSPKATPDRLDRGALQDMGDQTLALTSALASAEPLPARSQNRTFFDVFGLFVLDYGTVVGWALFALAAILQFLGLRAGAPGAWRGSLAASATIILGGGIGLYAFNRLSGAAAGPAIYYDRLAAIPLLEAQAALICMAALVLSAPLWAGRSGGIVALVLGIGLQIAAPTTSFIIVWPLLLGGIVSFAVHRAPPKIARIIATILGAITIGFLLQYGHQFMQGVGPDLPMVAALLTALAVPVLGPTLARPDARKCALAAAIMLTIAGAIALWVRFDPVADTVPVYRSMKG